ncbi:hypothetical protein KR018_005484, partial [Drosophila ironensis]
PTFRDLFTAIYRNNPRLTEVEKLFHLNAKTTGEAHDIVSRFPLTNDGFQAAWAELTLRFENRRLLVNGQLKQLFGLKPIAHESSGSIQKLHSTVHGCLTALRFSQINTDSWDCLLVFLVTSRLPRLTLSLWEQSLQSKTEIASWAELDTFLLERHRTLVAIEGLNPGASVATQPKQYVSVAAQPTPTFRNIHSFESKVEFTAQR